MTKLIGKDDPLYFGQTSDKPYDRHHYKTCVSQKHLLWFGMRFKSGGGTETAFLMKPVVRY